jgi:hypothetical protein
MLGDVLAHQQRHAPGQGTLGDVLDQLAPGGAFGDHADRSDQPFGLAADVGCVPRRPPGPESGEHQVGGDVAVEPPDRQARLRHRVGRWGEAEGAQFAVPCGDEVRPASGYDLVGSRVRPRASVPGAAQSRPGLLAGVLGTPAAS